MKFYGIEVLKDSDLDQVFGGVKSSVKTTFGSDDCVCIGVIASVDKISIIKLDSVGGEAMCVVLCCERYKSQYYAYGDLANVKKCQALVKDSHYVDQATDAALLGGGFSIV